MTLKEYYIKKQQEEAEFFGLFDGFVQAAFDEMERKLDELILGDGEAHQVTDNYIQQNEAISR